MPATLSIKNAPDSIVERLRQRAARNHRSLQGELMAIIEAAVETPPQMTPLQILERARELGLGGGESSAGMIRADRDRDNSRA